MLDLRHCVLDSQAHTHTREPVGISTCYLGSTTTLSPPTNPGTLSAVESLVFASTPRRAPSSLGVGT